VYPTAFVAYTGEALDKKNAASKIDGSPFKAGRPSSPIVGQLRLQLGLLQWFGPEQEYFVIDKKLYERRKDLILTGRTLFGAKPPKGQELERSLLWQFERTYCVIHGRIGSGALETWRAGKDEA